MATNANADDYAAARQNIWFTAHNQTPADGNLTGQCVTLLKWFFNDMVPGFPVPFMARGNAKDVGRTLVAQGLAVEVPYAERRRGDVICYEYGLYGHIASQLSGGRVFESNVNWTGVATKIVDGERVYASRIGSENEAWRVGKNAHVYRLKGYNEGEVQPMIDDNDIGILRIAHSEIAGWDLNETHSGRKDGILLGYWKGKPLRDLIWAQWAGSGAYRANREAWRNFYNQYSSVIGELSSRPTKEELAAAMAKITEEAAKVQAANDKADKAIAEAQAAVAAKAELEKDKADAEATGNAFMRWLGGILSKLKGE